MNQDFSELIEYLDKKFEKTATKEDVQGLSTRILVIEEDTKEMKTELAELKETVHELVTAIDKLAKVVDDLRIEYSAMSMQISRHERWFQQVAEKIGIKLEY